LANFRVIIRTLTNEAGFGFDLTRALIDNATDSAAGAGLPKNSKIDFVVNVLVEVGYADTSVKGTKRYDYSIANIFAEAGADKAGLSMENPIDVVDPNAPSTTPAPTGTPTTVPPGPTTPAPGPTTPAPGPTTPGPTNKPTNAPVDGGNGVALICSFILLILALL